MPNANSTSKANLLSVPPNSMLNSRAKPKPCINPKNNVEINKRIRECPNK